MCGVCQGKKHGPADVVGQGRALSHARGQIAQRDREVLYLTNHVDELLNPPLQPAGIDG